MGGLFGMNSRFAVVMSKAWDLIVLNIVFLLTCIPIVTIGPAVTAMHTVTLKMINDEEAYVLKNYCQAFRLNLKPAGLAWVIIMAVSINFVAGYYLADRMFGEAGGSLFRVVLLSLVFLEIMMLSYLFPLIAKFQNSLKNYFKFTFMIAIAHPVITMGIVMVDSILLWCIYFGGYFLIYGMPAYLLIGFALTAYINSLSFSKVFNRHACKGQ